MRKTLFLTCLLLSEIVGAQTSGRTITARQVNGHSFQFVDQKNQLPVNNLLWDEVEPFVYGYSRVLRNNKFSFVNISGKPICPVEFEAARNFNNKLVAVRKQTGWGFMNESGKIILPCQYEIVFDFNETVTAVFGNKKWYLVNSIGHIIKPLDISVFYGFKNGIARIEKDGNKGTMNTSGDITMSTEKISAPTFSTLPYRPLSGNSSTLCPDNIDFEYGSFLNWKCFIGKVDSVGNTNVITVNPSPPTPNRHTLYARVLPSPLDPFGLFPTNPPDGSNFAVRLGNTNIGAQAERIRYSIHVPINDSNFSIKYDYAVVFQDPGHTPWTQPRFNAKLFDSAANTYVPCASFEYIATSSLPGFAHSTVDSVVMFKPWSSVFVSLRGYAGKTMFLEFTTADCVRRGHWGYAYVDVEKPCGQSVEMQYDCNSPNVTTLDGPPGFQTYNWWDSSFTSIYAVGQHVILNPGPAINTTIWLEMVPYNNFGCKDTIPVKITGVFNANFTLSDTVGVCAPHSFTFYNADIPATSAIWNFGDGNTGSGDTVTHVYALPGNYIVTLNVILPSGCIGSIQKTVSVLQPVGSFYFNGAYFCNSQQVQFDAVVNNADSLFWDFGDGVILPTTQTSVNHTYALPGLYLPYLTAQSSMGCQNTLPGPDTIRIEKLKAGFFGNLVKTCGSTTLNLTDTSYAYFGISSTDWDFGDGTTGSGTNVSHTYTVTGTYNIQLIITGISGCFDTIVKPIFIKVNDLPVAAITGAIVQCQQVPVTFNSTITAVDSINYIHWTSSNGASGSGNNFTVNYLLPGNYTIQLIVGTINGCFDTTTHAITINPNPDVVQPADQALCNGASTTSIHYTGPVSGTTYTWSNNNTSIGLAASGTGDINSFIAINNTNAPVTSTISISTLASGCPGPPKAFTITVNPTPDVIQPSNQVLCRNSSTAAINFTGSVAGSSFTWTNNNPTIGLAASGTGDIPSFTAINNTNIPVTATITVRANANGCSGTAKVFTIIVNPIPDVIQPADQVLCNGSTVSAINFSGAVLATTYTWTNNNTAIGLAATGTGDIASYVAVNNTNIPITATISVLPTAYGCPGASKTFTITINPTPDVLQPVSQVLCKNSNTNAITFSGSVVGNNFTWTNSNTAIGLAANGTGNIPSFTAINNTSGILTSTITVNVDANGCTGPSKTFTIIVNPTPDVIQPADQVLCNGATVSAINFTGAVSGTTYTWSNNNTAIGLAANGTGNISSYTAVNNTNTPITALITVAPDANGCPGATKSFSITINPTPDVVQPVNQVLCRNSLTSAINFSGSVSASTFTWTNSNTAIGLAANGTGDIPSFTATNNTSSPITATIFVNPDANGCSGTPKVFTIIVNPIPDVIQPADQVLCNGSTISAVNFSGAVASTIYSWSNDNTAIGLVANGTGNIASYTAVNNTNSPITAHITVSPTAYGCPGSSKTFTITINPTPDVVQPVNQVLCRNSLTSAINFSGSVNASTFTWTNNNTAIGLAANGTGDIPSFTATNNTSSPITATISVNPDANGCSGTPKVFTIIVNPIPDVIQPADQVLCNGSTISAVNFSGAVASAIYSWSNDNTAIGLAANGTGDIASYTGVNNSNVPVMATITVVPNAYGCPGLPKTFTITINPTPDVAQPNNQVLCKNAPTTAIIFNSQVSGSGFTWTNNNTFIGLASTGTGDIPSFTAINNTTQPVTATITVRANANGCSGPAKVFTITVNPSPAVTAPLDHIYCNAATTSPVSFATAVSGATFTWTNDQPSIGLASSGTGNIASFTAINNSNTVIVANIVVSASANGCQGPNESFSITINPTPDVVQPIDQSLCNGSATSAINFSGAVSGTSYSWTNSNTSIGLVGNGIGNIASFIGLNNSNIPVSASITVSTIANGCPGQTKIFNITVNPTTYVTQPVNQVLCNGSTASAINFVSTVTGTNFSWTNSNPAIGLAASGNGNIPAFTVLNTSSAPILSVITVTPVAGTCSGPAKTFNITVNPTPAVSQPGDQTICHQSVTTRVAFTGSVAGTHYDWINSNTSIGLAANGTGDIAAFTVINNTNTPSTALITVTPTANNCPGIPKNFIFVVKPAALVIQPANQSLCNKATTTLISFNGTQTGSTFNWTNNNSSVGLAASGTGNIIPFTAINNTSNPIIALVNVTASANGCTGPPKTVSILINPTPTIVASNDMNVCLGRTAQLTASGAAQYSWTPLDMLSCSNCQNPVSSPIDSIKYIVKGTSATGCIGFDSVKLNVIKPFRMAVSPDDTLCRGESTRLNAMMANSYLWSPAAGLNNINVADPTATPQTTTTYQVIGFDGHQCFTDTGYIKIIVGPKPTVDIGPDINTQTGTTITLHPVTQFGPIVSYLWTPATDLSCTDCATPVASIRNNITYSVTVKNNFGCTATDRISINVFCQSAQVFIPNAFTPDGDGLNDILMIRGTGIFIKSFRIFSRWGELVFEKTNFNPNDPKYGWDGKLRGVTASPDVFVYTAEVVCDNGIVYTYKGNTTVLK